MGVHVGADAVLPIMQPKYCATVHRTKLNVARSADNIISTTEDVKGLFDNFYGSQHSTTVYEKYRVVTFLDVRM